MTAPLRIAILTHSTNPRGGVVHALELGDALTRLGHDVTVHAPDPCGAGFFRPTLCRTCRSQRRRPAAMSPRWSKSASPTTSGISSAGQPALRRLACAGRHFGKRAGDAQGARPDRRLCPHRAPCRPFRRSAPLRLAVARHHRRRLPLCGEPPVARLARAQVRCRSDPRRQRRRHRPLHAARRRNRRRLADHA